MSLGSSYGQPFDDDLVLAVDGEPLVLKVGKVSGGFRSETVVDTFAYTVSEGNGSSDTTSVVSMSSLITVEPLLRSQRCFPLVNRFQKWKSCTSMSCASR